MRVGAHKPTQADQEQRHDHESQANGQERRPHRGPLANGQPAANGHAPAANGRAAAAPPPAPAPDPTVAAAAHARFCFDTLAAHLCGRPLPRPSDAFGEATCALFVTWNKRAGHAHGAGKQHRPRPSERRTSSGGGGKAQQQQHQDQQHQQPPPSHRHHPHDRPPATPAVYHLRGCIGTLEPRTPLRAALRDYALTSALRDHRFAPVAAGEVPALKVTVSLLRRFERAAHPEDWSVGTHGIIVAFAEEPGRAQGGGGGGGGGGAPMAVRRSATFLPEVAGEQGWTRRQAVEAAVRKSGYAGALTPGLMASLQVTRYQSSRWEMTYGEWRRGARAPAPAAAGGSAAAAAGAPGLGGGGGGSGGAGGGAAAASEKLVAAIEQRQRQQQQQEGSSALLRALRRLLRGPVVETDDYEDDYEEEEEEEE